MDERTDKLAELKDLGFNFKSLKKVQGWLITLDNSKKFTLNHKFSTGYETEYTKPEETETLQETLKLTKKRIEKDNQ